MFEMYRGGKMFKRLVTEKYEAYNNRGQILAEKIKTAVEPIIDNYIDNNFSMTDISFIVLDEISYLLAEKRLNRNNNLRKEK